uniref:Uncharacterized protein n=1 Tax=Syphacia muris TaxID=451379 RepID=A0A0N5APX1_9BILA
MRNRRNLMMMGVFKMKLQFATIRSLLLKNSSTSFFCLLLQKRNDSTATVAAAAAAAADGDAVVSGSNSSSSGNLPVIIPLIYDTYRVLRERGKEREDFLEFNIQ